MRVRFINMKKIGALGLVLFATTSLAQQIKEPSACGATPKAKRPMCQECTRGGGVWEYGGGSWGCAIPGVDSVGQFHRSKAIPKDKPIPKPASGGAWFNKYVDVPAGSFTIGSQPTDSEREGNEFAAPVKLTHAFKMKVTEVTQGEWHFVMGQAHENYDRQCGVDCPVRSITFLQVLEFLNKLSEREKLERCYAIKGTQVEWVKGLDCSGYRLPTEAEWEFAARAGIETPRYGELKDIALTADNNPELALRPVANKKPNASGLHDMLGSIAEWTWDEYRYDAFNPEQNAGKEWVDPIIGGLKITDEYSQRTSRGGNGFDRPQDARFSFRVQALAGGSSRVGFRPVRSITTR
ncbi:MAG: formylglycine-generating enzyme family protein [Archangium sp.]